MKLKEVLEQHALDTNAWKQLSYAATDIYLTLMLKKLTTLNID